VDVRQCVIVKMVNVMISENERQEIFKLNFDLKDLDDVVVVKEPGVNTFPLEYSEYPSNRFVYIDNFYKYPEQVREYWISAGLECKYTDAQEKRLTEYTTGYYQNGTPVEYNRDLFMTPINLGTYPGCRYLYNKKAVESTDNGRNAPLIYKDTPEHDEFFKKLLIDYYYPKSKKAGKTNIEWHKTQRHMNHYVEGGYLHQNKINFGFKQPHYDSTNWAWLMSLTDPSYGVGGTAFYRHKESGLNNHLTCENTMGKYKSREELGYDGKKLSNAYCHSILAGKNIASDTFLMYLENPEGNWEDRIFPNYYWEPDFKRMQDSDDEWEKYYVADFVYNRFHFFHGKNYHSPYIEEGYYVGDKIRYQETGFLSNHYPT